MSVKRRRDSVTTAVNLFKHQAEGVQLILKHKHFLLGYGMGTGKSLTALQAAKESGVKRIVIFCPAFLVFNWHNEIKKWTPELSPLIKIVSYSKLKGEVPEADFVICDESHLLKNLKAQRTQILHNFVKILKPEYLVLLSGTPSKNRILEMYSPLKLLSYTPALNGKKMDMSYWTFCETFSNKIEKRFGGTKVYVYEGVKNLDLFRIYLVNKFKKVNLIDVAELPDLVRSEVRVSSIGLDRELLQAYSAFNDKKSADHFATVKMNNALKKVPFTVQFIKNLQETVDTPLVIFSDHPAVADALSEELGGRSITGSTSIKDRVEIFNSFQEGKIDVLCGTIGAMSTGVNLTRAQHVIFNDIAWVDSDIKQAEARIFRLGQGFKTVAYFIVAGDIDSYIFKKVRAKSEDIKKYEETPS